MPNAVADRTRIRDTLRKCMKSNVINVRINPTLDQRKMGHNNIYTRLPWLSGRLAIKSPICNDKKFNRQSNDSTNALTTLRHKGRHTALAAYSNRASIQQTKELLKELHIHSSPRLTCRLCACPW